MPGPSSSFISRTAAAGSVFTSVVLFHAASLSVREKTTFLRLFMCLATSGIRSAAIGVGQKLAII